MTERYVDFEAEIQEVRPNSIRVWHPERRESIFLGRATLHANSDQELEFLQHEINGATEPVVVQIRVREWLLVKEGLI